MDSNREVKSRQETRQWRVLGISPERLREGNGAFAQQTRESHRPTSSFSPHPPYSSPMLGKRVYSAKALLLRLIWPSAPE